MSYYSTFYGTDDCNTVTRKEKIMRITYIYKSNGEYYATMDEASVKVLEDALGNRAKQATYSENFEEAQELIEDLMRIRKALKEGADDAESV